MHLEIELKLKLNNDRMDLKDVIIPRIEKLAAENRVPSNFIQKDAYYDFPNGETARIRVKTAVSKDFDVPSDDTIYQAQTLLTVKQRSRIELPKEASLVPSIECNKEYEETVCDNKNLPQMLELLGGKKTVVKTKKTMIWNLPRKFAYGSGAAPHIEVSSVDGLGTYIEIETLLLDQSDQAIIFAANAIQDIKDALNLDDYAKVSIKSYSAEISDKH